MKSISFPVRLNVIIKYLGQLGIALAALTTVPFIVSLVSGEYNTGFRYGIIIVSIMTAGIFAAKLPAVKRMQTNEAMVVTALAFLITPLLMSWPVMASGLGFADAFFETISGVTTTGLSTIDQVASSPQTLLFSRAWMQWVGGLGIVVLCLVVIIQPGAVAKQLGRLQAFEDDPAGSTRGIVRTIFIIYSVITVAGIFLLVILGTGWFEAVLYVFSAVSTGGFSPHNSSLGGLPGSGVQAAVTVLSITGALPLIMFDYIFTKQWRRMAKDPQIWIFLAVCAIVSALLTMTLFFNHGLTFLAAARHGFMNGVSAQTTAGFSSLEPSGIDNGSKMILIAAMLTGGCSGSTAGGVKILRLWIMVRVIHLMMLKCHAPPNAVMNIRISGNRLGSSDIQNALGLLLIFICFIFLSWFPFVAMGYPPLDSLFEVVSAMGTAGLSSGLTNVSLPPLLKSILCVDMLLGRLEIFAWLIFFSPGTWIGTTLKE